MNRRKRRFFDRMACSWEQMFYRDPGQSGQLNALVRRLGIPAGARVLDIGCGTGVMLERLSRVVGKRGAVIGCDFSLPMLSCASRKAVPNSFFVCCDAHAFCFQPEGFDALVYFSCFPHFDHKLLAIREASRMLKPGGLLCICHLLSRRQIAAVHRRVSRTVTHDTLPARRWMTACLKKTGLLLEDFRDSPGLYLLKARKPAV